MKSKRSIEGYYLNDNRTASMAAGMPAGVYESATITCSHCQRVVILRPDRSRARGYCPKCDHYVCDACEAVRVANAGACVTMNQIIDEIQEAGAKGLLGLFGPPKAPGSAPPSLVL